MFTTTTTQGAACYEYLLSTWVDLETDPLMAEFGKNDAQISMSRQSFGNFCDSHMQWALI